MWIVVVVCGVCAALTGARPYACMSIPGTRRGGAWRSRPSADSGSMTFSLRPRSRRVQAPSAHRHRPPDEVEPLICAERGGWRGSPDARRCRAQVQVAAVGRPLRSTLRRTRGRSSCPPIDSRGWPFSPSRALPGMEEVRRSSGRRRSFGCELIPRKTVFNPPGCRSAAVRAAAAVVAAATWVQTHAPRGAVPDPPAWPLPSCRRRVELPTVTEP